VSMENPGSESTGGPIAPFDRRPWGRGDLVALAAWSLAIAAFFWDVVALRRALFYFDITEINYPYRAFFADELKAGRFSRWCPGLYCGLPLFSESQAGYLHPFKYLFYPWLATWQALNLDTVFSIWLTGVGTYLWLRRHVGPAGALTGAAILGLSGFTWGHLIHTSMINALASVPFVIWGLEASWSSGRWRGAILGGLALACQVFAGHLQDALFSVVLVGIYGLYRAATAQGQKERVHALGMAAILVVVGVLVSGVQWVPSKELLDRSPRAGGLSWNELVYASWHPELLPTLVIREAYGTRARDTGWMNGFYPYHEMNAYMGLIAMALAVIGAGGPARRDRWATFWVILIGLAAILMLGKFTILYDRANAIPVLGSSREPVRFSLWLAMGVAALAAVGVDRLSRPGAVTLRGGLILAGVLVALSIPIMIYIYKPAWIQPNRWNLPYHHDRYRWLGRELKLAAIRTTVLATLAWGVAWIAARSRDARRRARWAAVLPLLVMADLLGSHWYDVATVESRYWTEPPETARRIRADPGFIRVVGVADKSSGEPGYASEEINFLGVRDTLDWSLPLAWHLATSRGITPMYSRRLFDFGDPTGTQHSLPWRLDLEGDTHIVSGLRVPGSQGEKVGTARLKRYDRALPRARIAGRPVYALNHREAVGDLLLLKDQVRDRLVVEDPTHPLPSASSASGTARIVEDLPERVVVEADLRLPGYLVLSDTYDPGWSATVDGRPAPICPAYVAFRAVYLGEDKHTVVFTYRPAGFALGLMLTCIGVVLGTIGFFLPRRPAAVSPDHAPIGWFPWWRMAWFLTLAAIVLASAGSVAPRQVRHVPRRAPTDGGSTLDLPGRWWDSVHTFTWGAGEAARKENRR
jgi:hypothetical protein